MLHAFREPLRKRNFGTKIALVTDVTKKIYMSRNALTRFVFSTAIGSLLALLTFTQANATVIYNWQPVTNGYTGNALGNPNNLTGQLLVADSDWQSGAISYNRNFRGNPCLGTCLGTAGLQTFKLTLGNFTFDSQASGRGLEQVVNLNFLMNGQVSGNLFSRDNNDADLISGAPARGLWSINSYTQYYGCSAFDPNNACNTTGRWVLDARSVPRSQVPIPATLVFLGIGLIGMRARFKSKS
jgi:hypothetical protein